MKTIKILLSIIATAYLLCNFSCKETPIDITEPTDTIDSISPADSTVRGRLLSLPESFSLLKDVLKLSGLAEKLADTTCNYTFFIQDNDGFAADEIYSISDLLAKLRISAPAEESDSALLVGFIAYHAVAGRIASDSLIKMSILEPLVDGEKIFISTDRSKNQSVLKFNDLNGHLTAPDAVLDSKSEYSDLHCTNGIIHKINGNLYIKKRTPYRIYWDIAEQPEIMALPGFRKSGFTADFRVGELSEINFGVRRPDTTTFFERILYDCRYAVPQTIDDFKENEQWVYGDYLLFSLSSHSVLWVEFTTPVLIGSAEGTEYTLWLCYRRTQHMEPAFTFRQNGYEDQILPVVFNMRDSMKEPISEGFKQYNAKQHYPGVCSHIMGSIKVYETGRHILRVEPGFSGRAYEYGAWDMIQFIPSAEDQYFPRIDMKGNWIEAGTEKCKIFPIEECGE